MKGGRTRVYRTTGGRMRAAHWALYWSRQKPGEGVALGFSDRKTGVGDPDVIFYWFKGPEDVRRLMEALQKALGEDGKAEKAKEE